MATLVAGIEGGVVREGGVAEAAAEAEGVVEIEFGWVITGRPNVFDS